MSIYDGSILRAQRTLARKGGVCKWRQWAVVDGDFDWTEDPTSPYTEYDVNMVILPISEGAVTYRMTFEQVDGDVERFTSYALMGAVPFTPRLRDLIIKPDGTPIKASGLTVLAPSGVPILYTIGLVG